MTDTLRKAAQAAFDKWADTYDHDSNEWLDMGFGESFIKGYETAAALAEPQGEPDAAGLLHDKAHVDTGKVRAAQSVRTPEMSYRPGSLPMDAEDKSVGWIYKFGKTTFLAKLPLTDEYIAGGWTAEPVYTRPQPLRELSDEEIDKAWRSTAIDYTAPYDAFRIAVGRAIIYAARKA